MRIVSSNCAEIDARLERSYLAALIDGEGSIIVARRYLPFPMVSIAQKNQTFLERYQRKFGGKVCNARKDSKCNQLRIHKPSQVIHILEPLLTYLILKRAEAYWAVELAKVIPKVGTVRNDLRNQLLRLQIAEQIYAAAKIRRNANSPDENNPDEVPSDDEDILQDDTELEDDDDDD